MDRARARRDARRRCPHIERIDGHDVWMADGERLGAPGYYSMAGFDGVMPASIPETLRRDPRRDVRRRRAAARSSTSRASTPRCCTRTSAASGTATSCGSATASSCSQCVRAYNDFLTDWCSADPDRLIAITALPFWDVDLAVAELQRCVELGHRAVNFCNQPQDYGQPPLAHQHWDPIWAAAQEAGVSVSFHVGGGSMGTQFERRAPSMGWMTNFAKVSSLIFLDNMRCIADLIFGGVCHRFPDLKLVSVESGVGWIPAVLEAFDWQWRNGGVRDEHPEYDLLPSEYFRRQIYGCFWFEETGRARRDRAVPRQHPVRDRLPAPDVPAPRARARPAQRPRDYAHDLLSAACPTTCVPRCCTTTPPRSTGSRERRRSPTAPDLGTPHLVAHVEDRVLHLRIDRVERRNAFTQDMYRGLKRAAIWADGQPELDAVCLTGTDEWFGVGRRHGRAQSERPRGPGRRVGRHRPLPVPPHRALPQAVGGEDQRRCATPAASTSRCTAT